MLEIFRQHKHTTGVLLIPALLFVWLAFSCQNCFADSDTDAVQKLHAAMDCCPSGAHAEHDELQGQGCDNNYLLEQAMLADEASAHLTDFEDVVLAQNESSYAAVYPLLIQPTGLDANPHYFSARLFSSYRILLI